MQRSRKNPMIVGALAAILLAVGGMPARAEEGLQITLGEPAEVEHPLLYYFPDSVFPFLPDGRGGAMMFWTDGISYRTFGPTPSRQGPADPTHSIALGGPKGCFDGNGIWMLVVHRRSADELIAFAHTENHLFDEPGAHAEWNYTTLLTSSDNGASWTRRGPIVYAPQPKKPAFGGSGFVSAIYDAKKKHWLAWNGWGGNTAFRSEDTQAAPGTWYGWRNGAFVEPGVNCRRVTRLPGMSANTSSIAVHYNTSLGLYVMVFQTWGNGAIHVATSADGLAWSEPRTIAEFPKGQGAAYPQVIGTTNTLAAGDATLTYSFTGHKFVVRPIRFQPVAPAAPEALTTNAGDRQVTLRWRGSLGATSYEIRRATDTAGPYEVLTTDATSLQYVDRGVVNDTVYHYTVVARNAAGTSPPSLPAEARPLAATAPPPVPTELDPTPGHAEVALGWKAVPQATDYSVLRALSPDGPYETVAAGLGVAAFLDCGLTNGTTYHYAVTARNVAGQSAPSTEVTATPRAAVPAAPRDLNAAVVGGVMKISWRASEVALTYTLRRSAAGGAFEILARDVANNAYDDVTAQPGVKYRYTVAARNFFGESVASEAAVGKIPHAGVEAGESNRAAR